jgi:isopentenyldiphosphate isomerase
MGFLGDGMLTKEHSIVATVDDDDKVIGTIKRGDVFRFGVNFRVVHIFLFNRNGELLIQKIAPYGTRSPGLCGSSVAGYVLANETYEEAARRKLHKELGVDIPLTYIGKTAMYDEGCKKFISLYTAIYDGPFVPDRMEIEEIRFIKLDSMDDLSQNTNIFTPTFLQVFRFYKSVSKQ